MSEDRPARRTTTLSRRLRTRLVILTLVPMILAGGVALVLGWNALSQSLSFLVEEVDRLSQVSSAVSAYVQSRELALQGLADLSPLPTMDPEQRRLLLERTREQAKGLPFLSYYPVSMDGTVIAVDPALRALHSDQESELAREHQRVVSAAMQGRRSRSRAVVPQPEKALLVLGQPLTRDGVVVGALVGWVDLEPALDLLRETPVRGHLAVWLVDGPTVLATGGMVRPDQRPFDGVAPGMRLVQSGAGPTLEGAVPVSPLGWYLKWVYPLPEVSELFSRLVLSVGLTVALAGVLAWILGGLLARRVAAPVEALSASTLAMARGDYSAPAPDPGPYRELEILTESFELMRRNLQRTLDENERLFRYTDGLLRARVEELRILYSLSEASSGDRADATELARLMMENVRRLLPDSLLVLWLGEEDGLARAAVLGLAEEEAALLPAPSLATLPGGSAGLVERPLVLSKADAAVHSLVGGRFPGRDLSGYCLVPVGVRGAILGVLEVLAGPGAPLEPGLVDLLRALGREVGLALENARLYGRSMAEKRFNQAVLEEMGDGVLTLDPQGRLATFNRAAERITGWDRREVMGRPSEDVFRMMEAEHPLRRLVRPGAEPAPFEAEFTVRGGTRKVLLFNPTVPPRIEDVEEAPAAIVVFRDVSRLREMEELRRDFTATISHELRTPLTAIKGYVATLMHPRARFDAETIRQQLGTIDQQVDVLNRLIADLLEAARLRNAALEVHPRRVDLLELLRQRLQRPRQAVRLDGDGPLWAWCDPEHMSYVIDHLLSNALKFSPPGGQVLVTASREPGRAVLSVQDFGVGIPPDQQERIFEMYHRVESGSTRIHYGVGVGLFIARKIVEAHGGAITVESQPGQGSTFRVSLPAAEEGEEPLGPPGDRPAGR